MPFYPIFASSVLITFIIGLGITSGPLPHVSPPKPLSVLLSPSIHATCLAYLTFLDLITRVRNTDYELLWSSFRRLLTPSTLGQNNNNNNNNSYLLQLGCHPVAVVILHVYKI